MASNKMDLIRQALGAAESSIKLAKQLLSEMEGGEKSKQAQELPGVVGVFDGENMVSEKGETFPVPANYASKSLLVVGDTLKLVDEGKQKRFKQVEHVKRQKTTGILAKKDGKWKAVTPEGSYKVLPAAVEHFGGEVGSEVILHLPAGNLTVPYGAIESVKTKKEVGEVTVPAEETKAEKQEVKKEPAKEPKKETNTEAPGKVEKKPESKPVKEEVKVEKKPASPSAGGEEKKATITPATKVEEKKVEVATAPKLAEKETVAAPAPKAEVKPEAKKEPAAAPAAAPAPTAAKPVSMSTPVLTEEDELT